LKKTDTACMVFITKENTNLILTKRGDTFMFLSQTTK
jgi:hypothetical protein